jgi:uncharacterized protein YuzE
MYDMYIKALESTPDFVYIPATTDINAEQEAFDMKNMDYDPDADAISIRLHHAKSVITSEITKHILIDLTGDRKAVGLEILDASEEISKIFGRSISKEEIKKILCSFTHEKTMNSEFNSTIQ